MPNPLILSQPLYFLWQAVQNRSHLYTITNNNNANSGIRLNVNVFRIDSQESSQVVISNQTVALGDSLDVDLSYLPNTEQRGDGLYKICVTPIQTINNYQAVNIPAGRVGTSIVEFPNTVNSSTTVNTINVGSTVLYNSAIDGNSDFSNPPTSLSNATNAIAAYLDTFSPALPAPRPYSISWVAPNQTSVITNDSKPYWRLIIYTQSPTININGTNTLTGLQLTSNVGTLTSQSNCILFIPDINPPTGYTHISSFDINGVNVLDNPININTELSILIQSVTDYLDTLGDVTLIDPNNDPSGNANQYGWIISPCNSLITRIQFMQQVENVLPQECIYELELTDTYECFMSQFRQYNCLDPCCENCGSSKKRAELFKKLLEMGLMYHTAVSMFQQVRFFYLGSTHNYDKVNTILYDLTNIISKFRKFVFECGYGCKEEKPCNCN